MSKVEVDQVDPQSGTTLTLGTSGDTVSIPSGVTLANNGTATGFGLTTQSVQTTGFTAVKGNLYPCNTTSAAFTVTLPALASVGDQVQILDYAGTFNTNNLTVNPNGLKIQTDTGNRLFNTNRIALTFTYLDSTQGWSLSSGYLESTDPFYIPPYDIDFLVVAGGGGGGSVSGGGGAGGYRTSTQTVSGGTAITVTVGDGGAGSTTAGAGGAQGSSSSISGSGLTTITSAGGGGGASDGANGTNGGSGGGGSQVYNANRSGNTPSTSPSQGSDGGTGVNSGPNYGAGGGGGASAVGGNGSSTAGANGGAGSASSITGSSVTYAGGGGGGSIGGGAGSGGAGGGGAGSSTGTGSAGTVNTGGGGGGSGVSPRTGGAGGKGVVILSMPDASYSGTTTGSPTVAVNAGGTGKTVLTFTGSGSYTG